MSGDIAAIAAGLTKSEQYVVRGGVCWSGAQRNRLIAKGIAPETCRSAPCLPKHRWQTPKWLVPLTPLGLAVRAYLEGHSNHE